jgi:hypothetical protein
LRGLVSAGFVVVVDDGGIRRSSSGRCGRRRRQRSATVVQSLPVFSDGVVIVVIVVIVVVSCQRWVLVHLCFYICQFYLSTLFLRVSSITNSESFRRFLWILLWI